MFFRASGERASVTKFGLIRRHPVAKAIAESISEPRSQVTDSYVYKEACRPNLLETSQPGKSYSYRQTEFLTNQTRKLQLYYRPYPN